MAIVKPDGSLSGAMDDGVFRSYDGVTVLSSKPHDIRNPRSVSQQTNRLKLRNIISMYSCMKNALKDNFQGKAGCQSDYTRFQACNMTVKTAVYLTYDENVNHACVVAPYVVSFGTLPTIEYHLEEDWLVTDIDVTGMVVNEDATMSEFVELIPKRNPDFFRRGDKVGLIACFQKSLRKAIPGGYDLPVASCKYCEFELGVKDLTPVSEYMNGFEFRVNEENKLCFRRQGACGLAIVRTRGEGRKALSSVQTLAVNNPILEKYISEEQKQLAIASYANKKSRKSCHKSMPNF